MLALGLFALGIFVGTIVTTAVVKINDWSKIEKLLGAIFSAVFAGVILAFVRLATGNQLEKSAAYYPIGLTYGLLWYYAPAAVDHVGDSRFGMKCLGWLHIGGLAVSLIVAGLIFFYPPFRTLLP